MILFHTYEGNGEKGKGTIEGMNQSSISMRCQQRYDERGLQVAWF